MQEKTLEELLDEYAEIYKFWDKERRSYANPLHIEPGLERMQEIISLISSREEKAREEGRKEEFNKICNSEKRFVESVITQYKEELLGKLPEEETGDDFEWGSHAEGWNDYREAVIKLL